VTFSKSGRMISDAQVSLLIISNAIPVSLSASHSQHGAAAGGYHSLQPMGNGDAR
jgi:hypothetical protein